MDDDRVLIEPRRIPGDPVIDHPVILSLFEPYLELLRKELKVRKTSLQRLRFPSMFCCTTKVEGKNISVFGTPLGCPQAAILLERLIAMGAKEIVVFGCCGSLQPDLEIGRLVIPTRALSEEGTSAHYPLPEGVEPKADEEISRLCLELGRQKQLNPVEGKVWTTDALFRETKRKAKRYSDMGILAVEMEMSALLTIAAYRRVRLGGCMVVSDELASLKWKIGFLEPAFSLGLREAARLAIEVCLSL